VPMSDMATKPRAICILGMHRSGTSAIARAVNLLGAYLGEEKDLMPPSPDNPEGYWERADITALHNTVLYSMKKHWDSVAPLPEGWDASDTIARLKDELIELIRTNFSGHPLWMWKDPRTSLLLPLWKYALAELGIELSFIFVVRNPLDIARSLKKRDNFTIDKGLGIWFNYTLAALKEIANVPTVFVSYDRFFANWEIELRRCAKGLKIVWPENDAELRAKMNSFIRPDLRHSASTVKDLEKAGASRPVVELYELFLNLIDGSHAADPSNTETITRLSKEFTAYASLFQHPSGGFCHLYIDTGHGFRELESVRNVVTESTEEIEFDLSKYPRIKDLRFDPIDDMVALKIDDVSFVTENGQLKHTAVRQHNALCQKENSYTFATNDPQLYFDLPRDTRFKRIKIRLKYERIGQDIYAEILEMMNQRLAVQGELLARRNEQLSDEQRQVIEKEHHLTEMAQRLVEKDRTLDERQTQLAGHAEQLTARDLTIQELLNSLSWKITWPLRALGNIVLGHGSEALKGKKRESEVVKFRVETKLPEIMTLRNKNRYLVEGWIFGTSRLKNLKVVIGKDCFRPDAIEIFRPDIADEYLPEDPHLFSLFSGFSVPILVEPVLQYEEREIVLRAKFSDGQFFSYQLGILKLEPWRSKAKELPVPPGVTEAGLLVICMATYNPKESRFRRQIESIAAQDFRNWICIISDDCSDEAAKRYMREILGRDTRFFLIEHAENVGFYHNFERCLEYVPTMAEYVALSDQDDYWYPNKLSECLKKFGRTTQLVYCDMRILHEDGKVISETYWKKRKNYYKREYSDLLSIANTVTGAASVFRASLLEKVLPFPPRSGNVFHDQWIAIVATGDGEIEYVDAALYDYIQSSANIIGHTDFGRTSIIEMLKKHKIWESLENAQEISGKGKIHLLLRNLLVSAKALYGFQHDAGKHIRTIIETASIRNLDRDVTSLIRRPLSFWGLLMIHTKVRIRRETTNNIELFLLLSKIVNAGYRLCIPITRRIVRSRVIKQHSKSFDTGTVVDTSEKTTTQMDKWITEFKRKFSGRRFVTVQKKAQVNFLLSRLDSANFFGGYIGMFNFAKKFAEGGFPVRILLTDQKEITASDLVKIQNHDPSLKTFLTDVVYLPCFSSDQAIPISADDIFVASSWWTAHIAHEAVAKTKYSQFIYLVQDYEPIFYENGAYRILAEQSYKFSYFPFFSTDILQRYFVESGILKKEDSGLYFRNPVLSFELDNVSYTKNRETKKKLLFYGRTQAHNARNLYPLGCLAIDRAREMGFFTEEDWEIISIGGDVGMQILPSGIKIKHIGKFDMREYKRLLPQHDLGLALMDSPHPSLLPIEMASAGLLVVTNTYGIKNQDYFANISSNIRAVSADFESLASALIEMSRRVDDIERRVKGSNVNWPHSWDDALPLSAIQKALAAVVETKHD
jgi:glycosyltransferase involved in cell wall biosynthesis